MRENICGGSSLPSLLGGDRLVGFFVKKGKVLKIAGNGEDFDQKMFLKFVLPPMGSSHTQNSARPLINTTEKFWANMSATKTLKNQPPSVPQFIFTKIFIFL